MHHWLLMTDVPSVVGVINWTLVDDENGAVVFYLFAAAGTWC